jgi:hypothetical protein
MNYADALTLLTACAEHDRHTLAISIFCHTPLEALDLARCLWNRGFDATAHKNTVILTQRRWK